MIVFRRPSIRDNIAQLPSNSKVIPSYQGKMTFLEERNKLAKERMEQYRTVRDELVRFLREDLGMTFGQIGKEFGLSAQRIQQLYAEIVKRKEEEKGEK